MDYELDEMIQLGELELYYEAHMEGIDGESFTYSIYTENELTDDKFNEIENVVQAFIEAYNDNEQYLGYIDISKAEDKVFIMLDLGNTSPEDCDVAIKGILTALNRVSGIESVIINEGCDFDF